jgi:molybdopterin synthase catalytic subunit
MLNTAITSHPIDVGHFLGDLPSSADGAVLLFLGVVRNHHDGRTVTGLVYEAYREMAERELDRITEEARERFGVHRIVALHRVGSLEVGEVSTAIGVATPHREDAYGASRYIIEEIKRRLPIWKLERYLDGGEGWVEGRIPAHESRLGEDDAEPEGEGRASGDGAPPSVRSERRFKGGGLG